MANSGDTASPNLTIGLSEPMPEISTPSTKNSTAPVSTPLSEQSSGSIADQILSAPNFPEPPPEHVEPSIAPATSGHDANMACPDETVEKFINATVDDTLDIEMSDGTSMSATLEHSTEMNDEAATVPEKDPEDSNLHPSLKRKRTSSPDEYEVETIVGHRITLKV